MGGSTAANEIMRITEYGIVLYDLMKGNGKRARWRATRKVITKKVDGRVETMGSHEGLESGEQNHPARRMKALDADAVNRNNRITENGAKSVKQVTVID